MTAQKQESETKRVRALVDRGPAGRPRRARGALPDPLRPHLRLPARQRRQPPRRRGPDDADVPEDARVDREVPLAVGAVLRVALPDRAQPRDGPLPRTKRWQPEEEVPEPRGRRVDLGRGRRARVDGPEVDVRADRGSLARAAAGADAEVRVQLRERARRRRSSGRPRARSSRSSIARSSRCRSSSRSART